MPADVFFDTSVLLYVVASDDERSGIAEGLLLEGGTISVQVLNEFAAVARRKLQMPWEHVEQALTDLQELCEHPLPLTLKIHRSALQIAQRYGFQIYDSLMVASAIDAGCTTLYSEDMQHGQAIDRLTIRNPFLRH